MDHAFSARWTLHGELTATTAAVMIRQMRSSLDA
jgi:hypothetical protein